MEWDKEEINEERKKLRESIALREYQETEDWVEKKAFVNWFAISLQIGMLGVFVLFLYFMINLIVFEPSLILLMVFLGQAGATLRGVWELANQQALPPRVIKKVILQSLYGLGLGIFLDIVSHQEWIFHIIFGASWLGIMLLFIFGLRRYVVSLALKQPEKLKQGPATETLYVPK